MTFARATALAMAALLACGCAGRLAWDGLLTPGRLTPAAAAEEAAAAETRNITIVIGGELVTEAPQVEVK